MVPKFRVWCKNRNEWERDVCYIQQDGLLYQRLKGSERLIPILPKNHVVMQSTGLKDKNGVEIFEGDIVVNQYGNVGYVAYLQQEAGFVVVLKKSDYRLGHRNTGESYDVTTNHEVIGNIHSNPELLE
ncbi:YopX family protein [Enterococcus sp.]|uniref:YopX family protein n=1 Tax=Enterococcus sp. TaxID=35783 RepID=UPI00283E0233|nr:YopX family protein [Enterococcus sp.]MDR3827229.1 YopX family protein [Enterococcus sp.]